MRHVPHDGEKSRPSRFRLLSLVAGSPFPLLFLAGGIEETFAASERHTMWIAVGTGVAELGLAALLKTGRMSPGILIETARGAALLGGGLVVLGAAGIAGWAWPALATALVVASAGMIVECVAGLRRLSRAADRAAR
jgi:hypothetical protein